MIVLRPAVMVKDGGLRDRMVGEVVSSLLGAGWISRFRSTPVAFVPLVNYQSSSI